MERIEKCLLWNDTGKGKANWLQFDFNHLGVLELVLLFERHEEYLLGLRELTRDLFQSEFKNVIGLDDVVLVKNPAKSRPYWSLGRVIRVTPGDDSCIRSVLIKKADGTNQEHSIKHLFPLELSITHAHRTSVPSEELVDREGLVEVGEDSTGAVQAPESSTRPRRAVNKTRNEDFLWY